jgi:hypothetical protein
MVFIYRVIFIQRWFLTNYFDSILHTDVHARSPGPFVSLFILQIKISTYEHMYGFSNGHPDPDVFDVSQCFAMDYHSTYLAVDITGKLISPAVQ